MLEECKRTSRSLESRKKAWRTSRTHIAPFKLREKRMNSVRRRGEELRLVFVQYLCRNVCVPCSTFVREFFVEQTNVWSRKPLSSRCQPMASFGAASHRNADVQQKRSNAGRVSADRRANYYINSPSDQRTHWPTACPSRKHCERTSLF